MMFLNVYSTHAETENMCQQQTNLFAVCYGHYRSITKLQPRDPSSKLLKAGLEQFFDVACRIPHFRSVIVMIKVAF